jgi:hypothetical protein
MIGHEPSRALKPIFAGLFLLLRTTANVGE